ncbi:MAG: glycosyltransferase family 4 protein [Candidatus Binatia bacterium]|jgi:glycosyltransferase involved in cell wall biosynthesis
MKEPRWSIAFVVPRYGAEIVGGAEALTRGFAERLPPDRFAVEVLTTCARDHHTWSNVLEPGEERQGSMTVRRFPVTERDVGRFLAVQQRLSDGFRLDLDEELAWAAGSVNSEALFSYVEAERDRFDAFIFLPYLFGTTLLGSQIDPRRSVLIPCLHDEPFAYLQIVGHLFRSVRGALFNSAPERSLARRLFGVASDAPVVGFGFDPVEPQTDGVATFRARHGLDGDYLLYFGRKEGGKNLPLLLDCFRACRAAGRDLRLVVAGDGSIDPSACPEGVVDLPRLSEAEKSAACAGALAVCQPSVNESFSIVLMESWLQETPALVNRRCAVTRHHVTLSNGGLYFDDPIEFAAEVDYLRRHPEERREMGRQGRAYVLDNYSWPVVLGRFEGALEEIFDSR